MNTTLSTTITHTSTTQYGHLRPGIHSEVMDNSADGKQADANKATDSMDTTLDFTNSNTTIECADNEIVDPSYQPHIASAEHEAPPLEGNERTPPYLLCKHGKTPTRPPYLYLALTTSLTNSPSTTLTLTLPRSTHPLLSQLPCRLCRARRSPYGRENQQDAQILRRKGQNLWTRRSQ